MGGSSLFQGTSLLLVFLQEPSRNTFTILRCPQKRHAMSGCFGGLPAGWERAHVQKRAAAKDLRRVPPFPKALQAVFVLGRVDFSLDSDDSSMDSCIGSPQGPYIDTHLAGMQYPIPESDIGGCHRCGSQPKTQKGC